MGIAAAITLSWYLDQKGVFSKIESIPEKVGKVTEVFSEKEPLFAFSVMGDNEGAGPVFKKIIEEINSSNIELVVHVGDSTARAQESDFQAVKAELDKLTVPFYPAIGNNDLVKPTNPALWQEYFKSDLYYSFNYQNSHFVILDNSNRLVGFDQAQLDWLDNDLASNKQDHTFLFFHRPVNIPLESFFGDDETNASSKSNEEFLKIIDQYEIDRIFCGHVHLYFAYNLLTSSNKKIPVTITGGAGASPQSILGGESSAFYHWIAIEVYEDGEIVQSIEEID